MHLLVGIEHDLTLRIIQEANWNRHLQFAAARLAQQTATHARLHHMQFRFTHCAFQTDEKPIVEMGGIINSVLIEDQRVSEGAYLQQSVPIARVACQAGYFQSDHEPGMTHAHLGHEFLESFAISRRSAGMPEIAVEDHDNAIGVPAQRNRSLAKRVLTFDTF